MADMTPRQVELAREALGLRPSRMVTSRNHFLTSRGDPDWLEWRAMLRLGLAWAVGDPAVPLGSSLYRLTRAAAESVLLPGERLNSEDWSS